MLRHIANSTRSPIGLRTLYRPCSQVAVRRYSNSPDAQNPKSTPPSVSSPPPSNPPPIPPQPKTPTEVKKTENQQGRHEEKRGGGGGKVIGIGFLLAAIAAGAAHYYPDSRAQLEQWGIYSTIDSVAEKLGYSPLFTRPIVTKPTPEPEVEIIPAIQIILENEPVVVQETHQQVDIPVEIVPLQDSTPVLTVHELVPVAVEATEIFPIEIIEIAQPDIIVETTEPETPPTDIQNTLIDTQNTPTDTQNSPETLLKEIVSEINEPSPPVVPSIDLHALLNAQAEQLDALREKLQEYYTESSKVVDERTKAHENAYHEALALRERIYRKELEEKLTQLQSQLQAHYEAQRQADKNEAQALSLQQTEQRNAELQREMEEALKAATDNLQANYSVLLAEEINKFDSKLAAELSSEEVKYSTQTTERLRAIEKLNGEVSMLETILRTNAIRLKENIYLHNVSSALFDLGISTLASPVRVSFVAELDRLEGCAAALGSIEGSGSGSGLGLGLGLGSGTGTAGSAVIGTVAAVLRPLAAVGVAPYGELTARFQTVVAQGRQAALVPEGGGIMDNLVAAVAAKLIIPAKGPVPGDSPEAIFAKAEYYLEHGNLQDAVAQLSLLRGMPASIVRDWLQEASDRLTVENSLKALHAHVTVLAHHQHSHLSNKL